MTVTALSHHREILFRPYRPWLVLRLAALLILAVGFIAGAIWLGDPRWLAGIGLLLAIASITVLSHLAHVIAINGANLICRRGVIRVRESVIPISRLDYEIRRTLPGRLLGYGTVQIHLNGDTIMLRNIASVHALQNEIARRQTAILLAPAHWRPSA